VPTCRSFGHNRRTHPVIMACSRDGNTNLASDKDDLCHHLIMVTA
jgi:hypothetical protein